VVSAILPLSEICQAAADLGSATPYCDQELAQILSAWLASVSGRAEAGDDLGDLDWEAALKVARWSARRHA
jgi:hypothetical protein